ncbi:conserved hypothetical protein [Neospora caninum Liverpool]|uniref:Transmembrane protein n=1 Tax=Neospora caninum (strain Liverpool) TaxID=572307 RepID=F0V746_NEOCL|nr:conserved hypothetical protein [Neospora caninum Liverpool]CBZ49537.1 conserved hypothetical protein [Neospora caninum Liverpool]CEL64116.1 TPA: hypothetical protein BN1204_000350 [Neospora caninum Liverpool]|eukprot:XP_003879572.1 conserved hypothetical protein [Neospora caninum Liverpool]
MASPLLRVCGLPALPSRLFSSSPAPLYGSVPLSAALVSPFLAPLLASAPPPSTAVALRAVSLSHRRLGSSERPSVFASFAATRVAASGTRTQRLSDHFVYHKTLEKSPATRTLPTPSPSAASAPPALSLFRRLQHALFLSVLTRRKSSALARIAWRLFFSRAPERLLAAKRMASEADGRGFTAFSQLEAAKKARKKSETKILSVALGCGAVTLSVAGLLYVVATWYQEPLIRVGVHYRDREKPGEPTTIVA